MKETKDLFFLVNGNAKIGFGHIMRCLIIAKEAAQKNIQSIFLYYDNDDKVNEIIKKAGFSNFRLTAPQKEDDSFCTQLIDVIKKNQRFNQPFLVIDSDGEILRTPSFQKFLLHNKIQFMHITVDNNSTFLSTLLLNQNIIAPTLEYDISNQTKALLGLEYFILNDAMKKIKARKNFAEKSSYDILLTFGSADPLNLTAKVICCLPAIKKYINSVVVILGPLNRRVEEVKSLLNEAQITNHEVVYNTREMYRYMTKADIAFTSMGLTFWELTLHNIPCIALSGSAREKNVLNFISDKNYCIKYGDGDSFDKLKWEERLKNIFINNKFRDLKNEDLRKSINQEGVQLVVKNIIEA